MGKEKKVLLSVRDLHVKFHVRGRTLTAIRGISLDIYEDESIAIVGESGCGKSVFTKTFSGMLDNNGVIDHGEIIFNNEELTDTVVPINSVANSMMAGIVKKLNAYSKLEFGATTYREILDLEKEKKERLTISEEEAAAFSAEKEELVFQRTEAYNLMQTFDRSKEKDKIKESSRLISDYDVRIKELDQRKKKIIKEHAAKAKQDAAYDREYDSKMSALKARYEKECAREISDETRARNKILSKDIYLSIGKYPLRKRIKLLGTILNAFRKAMELGVDLNDESQLRGVFDNVACYVKYLDETPKTLHGVSVLDLAKPAFISDWTRIRGGKIATVFQDPMTSLNPILTIGKQITSVIMKHQKVSETEAREKAVELMRKVGIPNAENRFDDYPFQYSGGMRQRIVIAIALSCHPKILICDEPTTALDVTIQAQILKLIKELQKEFHYTIVFITHDLGVVANIADRVAVLYAGQIIEIGKVEEIFYDPRHPYTWALLSSLPQLAERNAKLYSIAGTPPSLYNRFVGDAFAQRNPYCLKVDTLKEPPMFKVTDTHYAKTWLLDPRAPKIEKPERIRDIHGTLMKVFNI